MPALFPGEAGGPGVVEQGIGALAFDGAIVGNPKGCVGNIVDWCAHALVYPGKIRAARNLWGGLLIRSPVMPTVPSSPLPLVPSRPPASAANLPPELWIKILGEGHLTQYDLAQVRATNRDLRVLADSSHVWAALGPGGLDAPTWRAQANALVRTPTCSLRQAFQRAAEGNVRRADFTVQGLMRQAAVDNLAVPDLSALWIDARTQAHRSATAGWRAALQERDLNKAYPFFVRAHRVGKWLDIPADDLCYHPFYRDAVPLAMQAARSYRDAGDVPRLKEAIGQVCQWSRCLGQEPPYTATLLQNGLAIGIQVEIRAMIAAADEGDLRTMHVHHTKAREYARENYQKLPALGHIWARGRENALWRERLEHARGQIDADAAAGYVTSFEQAVVTGNQCAERLGKRFVSDGTVKWLRRLCYHRAAAHGRADAERTALHGDLSGMRGHVRQVNAWAEHGHARDAFTAAEIAVLENMAYNACLRVSRENVYHAEGHGDVNAFNKAVGEGRTYARHLGKPFIDEAELARLEVEVYRRGIACKSDLIRKHAPAGDAGLVQACLNTALRYAAHLKEQVPHEAALRLLVEVAKDRAAAHTRAHERHTAAHGASSHA